MSAAAGAGQGAVLPPGVHAGPLGARLLAAVVDNLVPAVVGTALGLALALWIERPEATLVLWFAAAGLVLAWGLLVWWTLAIGAASPGMRLAKLQLVGLADGRPIGWGRVLLRQLVWSVLAATGIGLVVLVVLLVVDVRHQGLHDKAGRAVVIKERVGRAAARETSAAAPQRPTPPASSTVGLPAHLTGQHDFSGTPGSGTSAGSASSAAEWTPTSAPTGPAWNGPQGPDVRGGAAPWPGSQPSAPGAPSTSGAPTVQLPAAGWGTGAPPSAPAGGGSGWTPPPAPSTAPQQVADERQRWGRPDHETRPSSSAASATPPPPADPAAPVDDGTRVVARSGTLGRRAPDEGWLLALEDGREVAVSSLVLIGRNPQPRAGEESAELVKVDDTSRTVSKTHIAIGVDKRGIYVVDRGSTNGSAIANSAGEYEPCAPGDVVRVREGQLVSFGQNRLEIKRVHG